MSEFVAFIVGAIVSAVATVFIYRNNVKDIGPLADKVDKLYDDLEKKIEEVKDVVEKLK